MIGVENSGLAKATLARRDELRALRSPFHQEWDFIAKLFRPQRQGFHSGSNRDGYNLHHLYNSTTLTTATNATATLWSTLMNPANQWFFPRTADPDLNEFRTVKEWRELVGRRMHASLAPAMSNFYGASVPWLADSVILGTGISTEELDMKTKRINDITMSPGDVYLAVDAGGQPNEVILEWRLTPVQAARKYGHEALPKKLQELAVKGDHSGKTVFIQAIQPNDRYVEGHLGNSGKPYLSTHVSEEAATVLKQGGFYDMKVSIAPWDYDSGETWARGLGYLNSPSAATLQQMERDNANAGALAGRPPIMTAGTRQLRRGVQIAPGKMLHGALSPASGAQLMRPLFTHQGVPISLEMKKQKIEEIQQGWLAAILSLVGRTGLNTLEVLEHQEQRLRLLSPYLGNIQSYGIATKLERRFNMLWRAGQIPAPPPELAGQPLEMHFTSVAQLAQRAGEGVATRRFIQDMTALVQIAPEAVDNADGDYLSRVLQETGGVPIGAIRPKEQVAATREARAEQAQAAQALEAAKAAAGAGKDLAQAQALGADQQ
ncbi:MAG: portal protein [Rhodobacterales bacterium]